jgi:hypothetical protein
MAHEPGSSSATPPPAAHGTSRDNPEVRHETSDVNIRAILGFGAALALVAVVVHVLLWLLFMYFQSREASGAARLLPLAVEQQNRLPAEPRLQTNPRQDLSDLRTREDQVLGSYGWVDKERGIVRIPIDEAMRLTVERGLPARGEQK